jgi:hypothetical protein
MKRHFSRLEAYMEGLVEGTFARLFAGRVHPRDVALQLARALEDSAAGGMPAINYIVHLNPADTQDLLTAHPDLGETLATEVLNMAREAQLTLAQPPRVSVVADSAQPIHTVNVLADSQPLAPGATQTMPPVLPSAPAQRPRAFVILDGERTISLREPVLNLGRRLDNHIIVDDPRVSRNHAQLRLRFGHYVVYDLGSTGGTFVNGKRIDECVLRPGDVISLGGVPVIYGEDGDRPTVAAGAAHSTRPLFPPDRKLPAPDRR